jgi:multicomponent Na+:H+ antiporter subunit C
MVYVYLTVVILFCLGLYAVLAQKNLIKIIIGINIMESALILLLIASGYREGGTAPIINQKLYSLQGIRYQAIVDPVPQALALTAIVIGASITAVMLFFAIKLNKQYGTLDISEIRRLRG